MSLTVPLPGRSRRRACGTVAAPLLAATVPGGAQEAERRTLAGDRFAVYNLAGEITAVATSGRDLTVEVQREGPDARALRVETGELRGRQTLRVVYPDDRVVFPIEGRGRGHTELRVRPDGSFGDGVNNGRRVRIVGSGPGLEAHASLRVGVPEGAEVALYLAVGRVSVTNVDGDIMVDVASAFVRTQGTRGRLRLDTGSGEVEVTDAEGEVSLDTGSGGARVSRVRGPRLFIDSGSGAVTGTAIGVRELLLDSGSGSVRLDGVSADDVRLDSGSGSVELALTGDVGSLEIDSGSGSVTLRIPRTLGAQIEVETGSGGLEVDVPIEVRTWRKSYLLGTIGDGEGRIRIDSGSGRVRLLTR